MRSLRLEVATSLAALTAVALAAGLEGGVELRMGMVAFFAGGVAIVLAIWGGEVPKLSKGARVAVGGLAAVVLVQALPMPASLRHIVAPGQAERLDRLAGVPAMDRDAWLTELTKFDLDILLGNAAVWSVDILAGAASAPTLSGAISPAAWIWQAGQWFVLAGLLLVGWRIFRSRPAALVFMLGMLALTIGEALFGLANRNGPSTGLSTKVSYLGSATGTFINRGHFGAFLLFGVASAWGLAASLFPLLPDEVRKHHERKRRSSQPPGIFEASGDRLPRLGLLGFATALLFVALLASTSRGPILSLLLAGVLVGAWTRFRRDDGVHLGIGLAVPVVGAVLSAAAAGPFGALARFRALGLDDVSLTAREEYWAASLRAFGDAPLLGAGLGSWRFAVAPHEIVPHLYAATHAHNEYVEVLVELGLLGCAFVVLLGALALSAVRRRLDVVDHDWRSSYAVGGSVVLIALAFQAIGDFHLRTPGVAIPAAITLGAVLGSLEVGEPGGKRWPILLSSAFGLVLIAWSGVADLRAAGTRAERLNEAAPVLALPSEITESVAVATCAAADAEPYNGWIHAACSLSASRMAALERSATWAFVADLASARALTLYPQHPKLRVSLAGAWLRLGKPTGLQSAMDERAVVALMAAVREDGWRAEDAFLLARRIGPAAIDRIGGSAATEPVSRARTLYQYAVALDEQGRTHDARVAAEESARSDSAYGPPAFRAGVLAKREGDATAAARWFRAFLAARDRPVGMEGWVLFHLDELDAAIVRFRRAVALNRDNRWAWEGLASVAREREDVRGELEAWQRVVAITPGHPLATQRLAELEAGRK